MSFQNETMVYDHSLVSLVIVLIISLIYLLYNRIQKEKEEHQCNILYMNETPYTCFGHPYKFILDKLFGLLVQTMLPLGTIANHICTTSVDVNDEVQRKNRETMLQH